MAEDLAEVLGRSISPLQSDVGRITGTRATDVIGAIASVDTSELMTFVAESGSPRTLQVGCGDHVQLLQIAHARAAHGAHHVIPRSSAESDALRDRLTAVPGQVTFATGAPEVDLAALFAEGFKTTLAFMESTASFEQVFLEFLYLDRMIVSRGTLVLGAGENQAMLALLQFIEQARFYEPPRTLGDGSVVLRRLGRRSAARHVVPIWAPIARVERAPYGFRPPAPPSPTASSADFAERVFTQRVFDQIAETEAALLDAEQRAGESVRLRVDLADAEQTRRELAIEAEQLREAQAQTEYWLKTLEGSASWRVTTPLRWVTALLRR